MTSELDADHLVLSIAGWWSAVPQVARMIIGAESDIEHDRRRVSVVAAVRRSALSGNERRTLRGGLDRWSSARFVNR